MISRAEVDKLLDVRAAGPSLLSLYLWVPLDPAGLRGLPAHAGELFALAARDGPGVPAAVQVGAADARAVLELLASRARDWLGHTVAIFACAELGLAEAIPLPCQLQERAVLAARPHVRPLLLAIQRCPAYRVAVVNRRHAWLFSIAGTEISTAALPPAGEMRSHGFSGWYGLQAHRVNQRIIQLGRRHYRDTATLLERAARAGGAEPLVIGGHQDTIPQFLGLLPAGLRDQFAGCFMADPHTLTPAKVRDLASRVIQDWRNLQDQRLAAGFLRQPPDGRTVTGLSACLAAANRHAIELLLVPAGGLVPGYACRRCGALSSSGDGCPHGATGSAAVPDLIEEVAVATLGDGGQAETLLDPPGGIAARLRYLLRLTGYTSLELDAAARPACRICCAATLPAPQARTRIRRRPKVTMVPGTTGSDTRTLLVRRLPWCREQARARTAG
jgi:Bacterial archaeo-eukaryotic release factor family 10